MPIDERLDEIEAQVLQGVQDNIEGLVNLVKHPINTAKGLFQVVLHPIDHAKRGLRFLYNEPVRAITGLTLGWLEGQAFNCATTLSIDPFQTGNFTMVPAFSSTLTEPVAQFSAVTSDLCVGAACKMPVAAATSSAPSLLNAAHSVSFLPAFQSTPEARPAAAAPPEEPDNLHAQPENTPQPAAKPAVR